MSSHLGGPHAYLASSATGAATAATGAGAAATATWVGALAATWVGSGVKQQHAQNPQQAMLEVMPPAMPRRTRSHQVPPEIQPSGSLHQELSVQTQTVEVKAMIRRSPQ